MVSDCLADKITDGEAEVMKVLWRAGSPIPFVHIRKTLQKRNPKMEAPTINTMVNRLVKKGIVKQEKMDVCNYYSPLVEEAEYKQLKTLTFLNKIYDGNARDLLASLASYQEVSESDLDELREILKQGGDGNA